MTRIDEILRERNLALLFDQHNAVNRQAQNGYLLIAIGLVAGAFAWYAAGMIGRTLILATCIVAFIYGVILAVMAAVRVGNLPQVDDEPEQVVYEQVSRRPMVQVTPRRFVMPAHGLTPHEWRRLCSALAGNRWKLTRALVIRAGISDMTKVMPDGRTRYRVLLDALKGAGMVGDDGIVPGHMERHYAARDE